MSNGVIHNLKYFVGMLTLAEHCRKNKLSYYKVTRLLRSGKSLEEALSLTKEGYTRKRYFCEGVKLSKYCEIKGVNYNSVLARVTKGMDIKEAVKKTLEGLPARLKKEKRLADIKKKEQDEEKAKKSIKVSASEKKKTEIINSIHNLKSMIRYLDVGSIDYNNAKNTIKSLEKELKDIGK